MTSNDLGGILKRIDKRLEAVKLTDRAASLAAGMSADGIRTMRRQWEAKKQKTATAHTLGMLARPLQTTTEWLMSGVGPEDVRDAARMREDAMQIRNSYRASVRKLNKATTQFATGLKVSGEVAAGTWRELDANSMPDIDTVVPAHPSYPANQQFAVVVRGNSVNRVAQYGDFLIVFDVASSGASPRNNDLVIVSRKRDDLYETTAKRYILSSDEKAVELRYDSLDPQLTNTVLAKLPLRASGPAAKADDGTEIAIKGIVIGIFRLP